MTKNLKVALLQTEIVWENSQESLAKYDVAFSHLAMPVDVVVLPEMFNTGFTMNAAEVAQKMDGEAVNWLLQKSIETRSAICGSVAIVENEK